MKHWGKTQRRRRIPGSHAITAYRAAAALRLGELSARQGANAGCGKFSEPWPVFCARGPRMAEELGAVMRAREMLRVQTNL